MANGLPHQQAGQFAKQIEGRRIGSATADTCASRVVASSFWKWAYSDFLSNALRGVLAEYIVANALNCTSRPRIEWDAHDIETEAGLRIEVKSAAYLQSWPQLVLSPIRFDIARKRSWDAKTNTHAVLETRPAHIYVFCVFAATDREVADPLNADQWFFLVCPTETLNAQFRAQKSVSLASLERIGLQRLPYGSLAQTLTTYAASYLGPCEPICPQTLTTPPSAGA